MSEGWAPAQADTEVEWLPSVPSHWPMVPAKTLFRDRRVPSLPNDDHLTPSQKLGVLRQVDYMEVTGGRVVQNLAGADAMKHVESGDFIIHLRSFQGGIERSSLAGKVSAAYTVVEPRPAALGGYFRWLLKSDRYIQALRVTVNQLRDGQSIRFADFAKIPLPLPPLSEQQAIADFLDRETTKIDALIEKQTALIERLRERRQLAIDHALPSGPVAQLRRDLAFLTSGSRGWAEFYADDGTPFIRIGNLDRGRYSLKMDDIQFVDLPGRVEGARTSTRPGDLLLSITAYLGSVAVVPAELAGSFVSQHVALARLRGSLWLPEFVAYAIISSAGQRQLSAQGYGGTKIQLSLGDVREVLVPVAPIAKQRAIADHLDQETAKIDALIAKAERFVEVARERRSALITAAVTGQLDITGKAA